MATRPSIRARNSCGKQVSLLNDEATPQLHSPAYFNASQYALPTGMARSSSGNSGVSSISSPRTPDLLRADSYDSQATNDPASPMTPTYLPDYARQSYTSAAYYKNGPECEERTVYEYPPPYPTTHQYTIPERPVYAESRTSSYADFEEDSYAAQNAADRGTKRYPCRYRESHHCEKTFTTSGHASRHSKIHTAEKAVHCTFQGCQKKFTRADNMKQHLETHYKSKNGSSAHKSASKSALTASAGVRKSVSRASPGPSRGLSQPDFSQYDPALYASTASVSPTVPYGSLDMGGVHSALMSRPVAARTETSGGGLDLLANIAALQS